MKLGNLDAYALINKAEYGFTCVVDNNSCAFTFVSPVRFSVPHSKEFDSLLYLKSRILQRVYRQMIGFPHIATSSHHLFFSSTITSSSHITAVSTRQASRVKFTLNLDYSSYSSSSWHNASHHSFSSLPPIASHLNTCTHRAWMPPSPFLVHGIWEEHQVHSLRGSQIIGSFEIRCSSCLPCDGRYFNTRNGHT